MAQIAAVASEEERPEIIRATRNFLSLHERGNEMFGKMIEFAQELKEYGLEQEAIDLALNVGQRTQDFYQEVNEILEG